MPPPPRLMSPPVSPLVALLVALLMSLLALAIGCVEPASAQGPGPGPGPGPAEDPAPASGRRATGGRSLGRRLPMPAGFRQERQRWQHWDSSPIEVGGVRYYPMSFDGHVHTIRSHDAMYPAAQIFQMAEELRLDALIVTDHGNTGVRADRARYQGPLQILLGQELGGEYGHVVAWGAMDRHQIRESVGTMDRIARWLHERQGLLVLAHPGWFMENRRETPMSWLTEHALGPTGRAAALDAVELWNGMYVNQQPMLVDRWAALLDHHVFVPIVASSDFHNGSHNSLGSPRTVVFCRERRADACLFEAARAGRSYLTDGPMLTFALAETLPGGVVRARPGQRLPVRIELLSPEDATLVVYQGRRAVRRSAVAAGQLLRERFEVTAGEEDGYVRVEVERAPAERRRTTFSVLSNPVRIDVGSERTSWRPERPPPSRAAPPNRAPLVFVGPPAYGRGLRASLRREGWSLELRPARFGWTRRPPTEAERAVAELGEIRGRTLLLSMGGSDTGAISELSPEEAALHRVEPGHGLRYSDERRWSEAYAGRIGHFFDALCRAGVERAILLPPAAVGAEGGPRLRRVRRIQVSAARERPCLRVSDNRLLEALSASEGEGAPP